MGHKCTRIVHLDNSDPVITDFIGITSPGGRTIRDKTVVLKRGKLLDFFFIPSVGGIIVAFICATN